MILLVAQIRGGVEETRLEAKAKDTKKIRGQRQPFRRHSRGQGRNARGQGQGLEASRPRPRTRKCVLEAKDFLEDSTSGSNVAPQMLEAPSACRTN